MRVPHARLTRISGDALRCSLAARPWATSLDHTFGHSKTEDNLASSAAKMTTTTNVILDNSPSARVTAAKVRSISDAELRCREGEKPKPVSSARFQAQVLARERALTTMP